MADVAAPHAGFTIDPGAENVLLDDDSLSRLASLVAALSHGHSCVALSSSNIALLQHHAAALTQALRAQPQLELTIQPHTEMDALLAQFNRLVDHMPLRDARKAPSTQRPTQVWLMQSAEQYSADTLRLLQRLLQDFPAVKLQLAFIHYGDLGASALSTWPNLWCWPIAPMTRAQARLLQQRANALGLTREAQTWLTRCGTSVQPTPSASPPTAPESNPDAAPQPVKRRRWWMAAALGGVTLAAAMAFALTQTAVGTLDWSGLLHQVGLSFPTVESVATSPDVSAPPRPAPQAPAATDSETNASASAEEQPALASQENTAALNPSALEAPVAPTAVASPPAPPQTPPVKQALSPSQDRAVAVLATPIGREQVAPAKPETTKPETAKPETAKPETAKPETAKPETAKPETAKPETAKPETAKPETAKPETAKSKPAPTTPPAGNLRAAMADRSRSTPRLKQLSDRSNPAESSEIKPISAQAMELKPFETPVDATETTRDDAILPVLPEATAGAIASVNEWIGALPDERWLIEHVRVDSKEAAALWAGSHPGLTHVHMVTLPTSAGAGPQFALITGPFTDQNAAREYAKQIPGAQAPVFRRGAELKRELR